MRLIVSARARPAYVARAHFHDRSPMLLRRLGSHQEACCSEHRPLGRLAASSRPLRSSRSPAVAGVPATRPAGRTPRRRPRTPRGSGLDAEQQAVFDTVEALDDWYARALSDATKPRLDIRTLRTLTGGTYTREYGRQVAVQQSNGVERRGTVTYTPLEVSVDGDRATAVTCFDNSEMEMYLTYSKPEEKVGTTPPTRVTFSLAASTDSPTGWEILRRGGGGACEPA